MKHLLILLVLCPLVVLAQESYPIEDMNTGVRPGCDFVQYAVGGWLQSHPLRDDQLENGAHQNCSDSVTLRMSLILSDLIVSPQSIGSTGQMVSVMLKQFGDTAQRNALGITPLQPDLQSIREARDKRQLQVVMARLARRGGGTALFQWDIRPDLLHADSNIVATTTYQLSIPRACYKSPKGQDLAIREAYLQYGSKLFEAAGYDSQTAKERMNLAFQLEQQLAQAEYVPFLERWRSQDVQHSVHKMSYHQLEQQYPEIDWASVFSTSHGRMDVRQVDVTTPRALEIACTILRKSDLEELKCLAELCLLSAHSKNLTQDIRREMFRLQQVLVGAASLPAQWKASTNFVSFYLSDQMGQLYCQRFFPPQYRERVRIMVNHITKAFRHRLQQNSWMNAETKREALRKLDNIVWEIGCPDDFEKTEELPISAQNTLYENLSLLAEYRKDQQVARCLNQPVDRHFWNTSPQTVNAFNVFARNAIFIPAGILQPPYFDPTGDEAINYGAIGTFIAHELTHGYDPIGCQLDSIGNVRNWWNAHDKRAYDKRTKVLQRYFGRLKCGGERVDGCLTLGENVADNGGLQIAFEAMQLAGVRDTLNGQTAAQRFFLGYARAMARNIRPQLLRYLLHNDEHAPSDARVNGALPHVDAWYDAFDITPQDPLYLAPSERAHIW